MAQIDVPREVREAARLIRRDVYEAMEIIYGEVGGMDDTADDVLATQKAIADGIRRIVDWIEDVHHGTSDHDSAAA